MPLQPGNDAMLAEVTDPGAGLPGPRCDAQAETSCDPTALTDLLLGEAEHRLRNVLALVEAITRQMLRGSEAYREFAETLSLRFSALASANDVFRTGEAGGATIGETVEKALMPFGGLSNKRISIGGPAIQLTAGLTLALRMTVHELCTNALKHGALSDDHGRLAVTWSYVGHAQDTFSFRWTESSARTVRPPTRPGFGTQMIAHVLTTHALQGPEVRYEACGVKFSFAARVPSWDACSDISTAPQQPSESQAPLDGTRLKLMPGTAPAPPSPFLALPGFLPDALPFAARTTLSLLLAYAAAFTAQVEAASTAGVCVAIIAQPSAGMAISKAVYRIAGTCVGGVAALALVAAFPQDRTMLLAGFTVWLGCCTFVSTLLRDFRSYAVALSGYTAGIIGIAVIDAPETVLLTTLDRVAAISIGILSVLAVNSAFAGTGAFRDLLKGLHDHLATVTALAADAVEGRPPQDDLSLVRIAGAVSALQTQVVYAALELPDGLVRSNGARHVITALLATISASREVARVAQGHETPEPVRRHLRAVATALRGGSPPDAAPVPPHPIDALLLQAADELLAWRAEALAGLRTLSEGGPPLPRIGVTLSYDIPGALIGALRTMIAIALISVFTVVSGWSGATLVLVQGSAVVTLLVSAPNPSKASLGFLPPLLPMALIVGLIKFVAFPMGSGFALFALAVGPVGFAVALMVRHPTLAPFATPTFLYLTLLLAPTNTQTFDLASFLNSVLELGLATVFVVLTYYLILPVRPHRRLYRVAAQLGWSLRRSLRPDGRAYRPGPALTQLYDRMARAALWLGTPTSSRKRLLGHLYETGEMEVATRRANARLAALEPELAEAAASGRLSLSRGDAAAMLQSAQALLDAPGQAGSRSVHQAAAALASVALLASRPGLMRFHRRFMA